MPQITLLHSFDAGHRIVGHKGKCARLHGHTYGVEIEIAGEIIEPGFVVDFGDLKDFVNEWDHKMLLWEQDPLTNILDENIHAPQTPTGYEVGVIPLPFNPTAENMATYLAQEILAKFSSVRRCKITLWETPKSSATYEAVKLP